MHKLRCVGVKVEGRNVRIRLVAARGRKKLHYGIFSAPSAKPAGRGWDYSLCN